MTHPNSALTYRQDRQYLSGRREEVWLFLLTNAKRSWTDREVKDGMGFDDMNCVRPRITELIKSGFARETGIKFCPITKKEVRCVRGVPLAEQSEAGASPEPIKAVESHDPLFMCTIRPPVKEILNK